MGISPSVLKALHDCVTNSAGPSFKMIVKRKEQKDSLQMQIIHISVETMF